MPVSRAEIGGQRWEEHARILFTPVDDAHEDIVLEPRLDGHVPALHSVCHDGHRVIVPQVNRSDRVVILFMLLVFVVGVRLRVTHA